jgi:hypothetical protein
VNPLVQTSLVNEVTIVVVPPEYMHLHPSGQLRSDEMPTEQEGFVFTNLEPVSEIKPRKSARKKKSKV